MTPQVIGTQVQQMFGSIAERYDCANTVLSLGIHHYWRRRFFRLLPKHPEARVLDLCTGTGDLLPGLAQRYAQVTGLDFSLPMIESGRAKWSTFKNISVIHGDALHVPLADHSVDLITIAFGIRNLESTIDGLKEMRRLLAPGGELRILEFGQPKIKIWNSIFSLYSRFLMPMIGGLITGNRSAYTYLPQTSKHFPCREQFTAMLKEAGFSDCTYETLSGGIAYIYGARVQ